MPEPVPACQGSARFDTEDQALYVARCHAVEFGTEWRAVACGSSAAGHWHVVEGADPDRACPHKDFSAHADIARLSAVEGGPITAFSVELRVECAACREPFRFIGVPAGLLPDRPACSVDETSLHIPIRPASSDPDFGLGMPGFAVRFRDGR